MTNSLNVGTSFEYNDIIQYCGPFFLPLNLFSSRYMLILYFHIFQRGFEVLNAIFQASVYVTIVTAIMYYNMYHC